MNEEDYGGEVPDVELEDEGQAHGGNTAAPGKAGGDKKKEDIDDEEAKMKERLGAAPQAEAGAGERVFLTEEEKRARDKRSVFVGNVDYAVTPEELQSLFQACGTVNQITIPTDKGDKPKGFAYVEFENEESVAAALNVTGTTLRGREIKVTHKRTNVPGMKTRGRGRGGFMYGRGGMVIMPVPMMMGFGGMGMGMGGRGRGRGRGRWAPY